MPPVEVTIRVHPTVKDCVFCWAESIGSEQQLQRTVERVQETNEADCCSFHGQVVAGLAETHGRRVKWITEGGE